MLLFRLLPYAVFFFAFNYSLGCPSPLRAVPSPIPPLDRGIFLCYNKQHLLRNMSFHHEGRSICAAEG